MSWPRFECSVGWIELIPCPADFGYIVRGQRNGRGFAKQVPYEMVSSCWWPTKADGTVDLERLFWSM